MHPALANKYVQIAALSSWIHHVTPPIDIHSHLTIWVWYTNSKSILIGRLINCFSTFKFNNVKLFFEWIIMRWREVLTLDQGLIININNRRSKKVFSWPQIDILGEKSWLVDSGFIFVTWSWTWAWQFSWTCTSVSFITYNVRSLCLMWLKLRHFIST